MHQRYSARDRKSSTYFVTAPKGRIDDAVPVVYPDRKSRAWILERHLKALCENGGNPRKDGGGGGGQWSVADFLAQSCRGKWLQTLDHWPWKDINELFSDVARSLDGWTDSDEASKGAKKELDRLTERARRKVPPRPSYQERQEDSGGSPELRREILFYALSHCGRRTELKRLSKRYGLNVGAAELDALWRECRPV